MPQNKDINKRLDELQKRIIDLESGSLTLPYPLDPNSKSVIGRALDELMPGKIFDIVWKDYFYYFDAPAIINAAAFLATWSIFNSGGTVANSASKLTLNTGGTDGDYSGVIKDWDIQNILRFDRRQRFRTAFSVDSVSNTILYLLRGDAKSGVNKYYGFKIVGNSLKGVTRNTGSEQTIDLMTISADTTYDLEAVLLPQEKIIFSIRDSGDDKFFEKGILTSEIPVGTTGIEFFSIYAETSATEASKQMTASYVEYIQKR